MLWESTTVHPKTTHQLGDRSWPDWPWTGNDSFGLPLIGTLLGYHSPDELDLERMVLVESPRTPE
jgi:hypothetical protein